MKGERFDPARLLDRCRKCGYDPVVGAGAAGSKHEVMYTPGGCGFIFGDGVEAWQEEEDDLPKDEHLLVRCACCGHGRRYEVLDPGDGDGAAPRETSPQPHPVR